MRSEEIILKEIKGTEENKYRKKSVSGILISLSYIDCLKLEYVCTKEKITIQSLLGDIVEKKLRQFEESNDK